MRATGAFLIVATVCCAPHRAQALCSYNGVDNAKTTIAEEFRDSKWVVRATVLSAADHISDNDDSSTTYEIEVNHAYKGHPAKRLRFFTLRDSGGFYMDRPWAGHDIGGEYLLFLNPIPPSAGFPAAAKGAVFVNYSCGKSDIWSDVPAASRRRLVKLEASR